MTDCSATAADDFYRRNQKWLCLLALALCYALFFHNLGVRELWAPDEDEYVLVNREMVLDGHWIYPTMNGVPYSIKPPLFNWFGSGISLLFGDATELSSRLPSAIAATAGLIPLYCLAMMLFGYRAAVLSVLVLATSPLYIEFGRWIQINMISTALLTTTLACFYWGYTNESRRTRAYLLMYAATALGTLNMGLVNVAMPTIVIGSYLVASKELSHLWKMRIGLGLVVFFAIAAPWYTVVSLRGGYAENLLLVTNFTRFFGEFQHTRPFYYYFETTPAYFLPWFVFLPGAFYLCFSERTKEFRSRLLFPFLWVVGLFVFFSLSTTKRSEYMLPIFPALALLVGFTLDRSCLWWEDERLRQRLLVWPARLILGIVAAAAAGGAISLAATSSEWLPVVLPLVSLAFVGAMASFVLLRRSTPMPALIAMVLSITAVVACGSGSYVEKRNQTESAKAFSIEANRYLPAGETLMMFRFYHLTYGVYTERLMDQITKVEELEALFASDRTVYVVSKENAYLDIKDTFSEPIHIIVRKQVGSQDILLLSNRASPSGQAP